MARVCDLLWDAFSADRLSWIGFYTIGGASGEPDQMLLAARRDKPACSPIGVFGVCGRGWKERRPVLVADVATLGPNYIACDPRDRSELVVPMLNADGTCWGVIDADSHETHAFDEHDAEGVATLCESAGLSAPIPRACLRI